MLELTMELIHLTTDGNVNAQQGISARRVNVLFVKTILAIMAELVLSFLAVDISVCALLASMVTTVNTVRLKINSYFDSTLTRICFHFRS